VLITVSLMLPVPTLLVASPVPVTRDTLEMGSHVWVSVIIQALQYCNMYVCPDIDECAAGVDNCDTNAACANTPGSFTCTCDQGYAGDGVTCMSECDYSSTVVFSR
jgi:hypothetical protein